MPRFKFHKAEVQRMARELDEPARTSASIQGKRPKHIGKTKPMRFGSIPQDMREVMRASPGKRQARNGVTVNAVLKAAPWRRSNYPYIPDEEK